MRYLTPVFLILSMSKEDHYITNKRAQINYYPIRPPPYDKPLGLPDTHP